MTEAVSAGFDRIRNAWETVWYGYRDWALRGRIRRHVLTLGTQPLIHRWERWDERQRTKRIAELEALRALL